MQDDELFASWLRDTLKSRNLRVMDLAKEIARREGIDEGDKEDFRRRSKAVHGNISNALNGVSTIGLEYALKIADALDLPHESVMRIAGLLPTDKKDAAVPATARGKIEALLASLPPEKQDEAIRFLEAYVITQFREQATPPSGKKQKLKKA